VRSDATTLFSIAAYWDLGGLTIGSEVFNVLNSKETDITYFYESRLPGEAVGVEDIHFHPVEPRQFRISVQYQF